MKDWRDELRPRSMVKARTHETVIPLLAKALDTTEEDIVNKMKHDHAIREIVKLFEHYADIHKGIEEAMEIKEKEKVKKCCRCCGCC